MTSLPSIPSSPSPSSPSSPSASSSSSLSSSSSSSSLYHSSASSTTSLLSPSITPLPHHLHPHPHHHHFNHSNSHFNHPHVPHSPSKATMSMAQSKPCQIPVPKKGLPYSRPRSLSSRGDDSSTEEEKISPGMTPAAQEYLSKRGRRNALPFLADTKGSPRDLFLSRSVGDQPSLCDEEDLYGKPLPSSLILSKSMDDFSEDFKRYHSSPAFVPLKTPDEFDDKFQQFSLSDPDFPMSAS